jgi:hypothetical protein
MDKRKAWRDQEQRLVERWNAAAARQRDAHAEIARQQPASGGSGPSAELLLKAEAANAELESLRREVARLKVEFNSGKRY